MFNDRDFEIISNTLKEILEELRAMRNDQRVQVAAQVAAEAPREFSEPYDFDALFNKSYEG